MITSSMTLTNMSADQTVNFTLDTVPPASPTFGLAPASDTPPVGDDSTTDSSVELDGTTSPGVTVTLQGTSISTVSDPGGAFQLTGVPLAVGANALTVVATDALGNSSEAMETITLLSSTPTISNFQLNSTQVLAGASENFDFYATVTGATSGTAVELYQANPDGTLGADLGPMKDDGDPLFGDAHANDGIYSTTFTLAEPNPGVYKYAAVIVGSSAAPSVAQVTAVAAPTEQRIEDLEAGTQTISDDLSNALNSGTPPAQAVDAIDQLLLADPDLVDPTSIDETSDGIAWKSPEGILSELNLDELGYGGLEGSPAGGEAAIVTSGASTAASVAPSSVPTGSVVTPNASATICGNALVISPYNWQFAGGDGSASIASELTAAGALVTNYTNTSQTDQTVTLAAFKSFSQYSEIAITTHGGVFPRYGVVLSTHVAVTDDSIADNLDDVMSDRLAIGSKGFAITPAWVQAYSGTMNSTVVYVAACHGARTGRPWRTPSFPTAPRRITVTTTRSVLRSSRLWGRRRSTL